MKPKLRLLGMTLGVVLLSLISSFAQGQTATIQTDKLDYPPGSTVIITGTGFQAGEQVQLQVLHLDTNGDNDTSSAHQPWMVTADASGNVSATWIVPLDQDELGATLKLTAVGQTSGLHAEWTFTDNVTSVTITSPTTSSPISVPAGCNVTVNYSYTGTNGGSNGSSTINIKSGTTIIATGTGPGDKGGGTGSVVITIPTNTAPGAYTVEVIVNQNGSITATQSNAINVTSALTTANAGLDQTVCSSSATLAGNAASVGTGTWTLISGTGTITSPSSPTSNITSLGVGSNIFRWTIASGSCSNFDEVTITRNDNPTTATIATTPLNFCGTLTSTSLGGNTPTVGTGAWGKVSGPGTVNFSAPTSGSSTATVSTPGQYVFSWTISNGVCTPSSANVTVNYYATPTTATVGATQNICGTLTSNSLGGNTPTVGTGQWTQTSGPGTSSFSAPSSGSSTATASAVGTYVYTWTISNGTCTPSSASVTVNYFAAPTTATIATTPLNFCGTLTSTSLGGNTPTVGTGAWGKVSGPGTVNFSAPTSGSSTATVSTPGQYVFSWTITNGTCSSSANVTVNYYATPTTSTVGASQNICGTLTSNSLGGNTPTIGAGQWTQTSGPSTSTFSAPSSGSSTATASVIGTYVYTWTISNGTCTPSSANITVNYYNNPLVFNVSFSGSLCSTATITLSGSETGVSYALQKNGTTVETKAGTGNGISFTPVTQTGTYTVFATNATTSCSITMNGSVNVGGGTPPSIFSVTGGGSYCSGGSGVAVGLSGSETGVTYQLFLGANPIGTGVAGTGSAISFGNQTAAGTYTVVGTKTSGGCTSTMTGSVDVSINSAPSVTSATNISNVSNDINTCSASVSFGNNVTATGSPAPTLSYKIGTTPITSPFSFPVGTTTVTVTATNSCGSDSKNFTVTVTDTQKPTITTNGDQTVNNDADHCGAAVTVSATAADNCSPS
ncbi:MAG: beta strand repeat-containing protein, partial [Flavisolibacter sp.]